MDSLRAARYPFLSYASKFASKNAGSVEDMLSSEIYSAARERGMQRVLGAIRNHEIPDVVLSGGSAQEYNRLMEVLSYLYARIIVSCVNDRLLTKRYALAEAERMNMLLNNDQETISTIVSELEINAQDNPDGTINMHFADFMRYSHVMGAAEWNLINMDLRKGFVRLEKSKFVRLLQNAYRLRIESELPLNVPNPLKELVKEGIMRTEMALNEMKARLSPTRGEGMKDEYLPPCIKSIISMAQAGQNLSHSARFALVSFLHALGMSYEQIVAVFAESPDFDESVSEYQIKHITGELNGTEGYTPPECRTMRTNSICFSPDSLCEHIKHPLNYYRAKSGHASASKG